MERLEDQRITFNATSVQVRETLATARQGWNTTGASQELCAHAEQVLAEVLNNVVEHAHAESADGIVELCTRVEGTGLCCLVRDNGKPMPGGDLPAGAPADVDVAIDDLPEGGFGWFLIRTLASDLTYRRHEGWNEVSFRIVLDTP